jgi:hypothetical protein
MDLLSKVINTRAILPKIILYIIEARVMSLQISCSFGSLIFEFRIVFLVFQIFWFFFEVLYIFHMKYSFPLWFLFHIPHKNSVLIILIYILFSPHLNDYLVVLEFFCLILQKSSLGEEFCFKWEWFRLLSHRV